MKLKSEKAAASGERGGQGRADVPPPPPAWSEVLDEDGGPRPVYGPLLERINSLPRNELRLADQRMEAAMRELGVTFDLSKERAGNRKPWTCDVLPHVFGGEEWSLITRGLRQRMRAFEAFLRDIYGHQEILRHGVLPIAPVFGSPHFQRPAVRLETPRGRYLHLGAVCLKRDPDGTIQVSSQHFGHAPGISYMVQNRRLLARVAPETFSDLSVASIAETPTSLLEALRDTADVSFGEPLIVMLSPGPGNAFYTEHSFLARRMGVPLVQGGDLLVLDDNVYLKTIGGLERVHVIYNRVADQFLDPLVLERGSLLGVPGLVHCIRKKTVSLVNALGSQLADDRALLAFAPRIIRFYLGEAPSCRRCRRIGAATATSANSSSATSPNTGSCRAWATASSAIRAGWSPAPPRRAHCGRRSAGHRISSSRSPSPKARGRCASRRAAGSSGGRTTSSSPCTSATTSRCSPAR